jgi:hypothetical protein
MGYRHQDHRGLQRRWDEAAGISLEQDADCPSCIRLLSRNTLAATLRAILYQAQQVDEVIASNAAARFGRFFDARPDAREHVVVLEPTTRPGADRHHIEALAGVIEEVEI